MFARGLILPFLALMAVAFMCSAVPASAAVVKPAEKVKPTEPAAPAEPTKPAAPAEPVETEPVEPVEPVEAEPVEVEPPTAPILPNPLLSKIVSEWLAFISNRPSA
ncbi:amelogenin-like [Teleopsis dalmanni]|uniref:amelogenin-like n=1 Tax=Teleopsis dalmanni TaxID=139649 RepID=UPI0018CD7FAE|nr:amelogenin-like [Teleopsis dalmanni]